MVVGGSRRRWNKSNPAFVQGIRRVLPTCRGTFPLSISGAGMLRIFQIIGIILLALGLAACSSLPPAAQEVASTFQATPTVETHPLSTRTGMQEIDQVLDVVASGDAEGLRALVQFTSAE